MTTTDVERGLTALAAMLSPTTLAFSVFALVLGDRPLRTGFWFFLGAFGATLAIGVLAAFVLGNAAATPSKSTPKTWVSILDVAFGVPLWFWARNSTSSSCCRSAARPFFAAASNAFMVGP